MRGYPKHLNSRADFDYVRTRFPKDERWLASLKGLISTCRDWAFDHILESKDEGVTDETHKVVSVSDDPNVEMWAQYEYRVNPTARIFRLGFTVEEVEALIAAAENGAGD